MVSVPDASALPLLQAGGFSASVDAFAWEPDPDPAARRMRLWFVSLLGSQQALKAVWARLLKGELATLSREATGQVQFCALAPEGPRAWRSYAASLPAAAGHQWVLLPEAARHAAALDTFLLLPRTEEETSLLYFRFLDRRVDLPLHVSWRQWLWERALQAGEAVALEAEGISAYRCQPDPDALRRDISEAIQRRVIDIPEGDSKDPGPGAGLPR
ncbi:MAG: hypothetical protein HY689_01800 [Chloroflexi bacterium]|nr:hypothetical protein [Chloroflexota bacterium]